MSVRVFIVAVGKIKPHGLREATEKLFIRRSGLGYRVTIHVQADATMSLHDSHALSGAVKAAIRDAVPQVQYVLVHMEPYEGARQRAESR